MIGIYCYINTINGKRYIGQSQNIERRYRDHLQRYCQNKIWNTEYNRPLSRALRKYGEENFNFVVLEECSIKKLNEREIYWIKYYNSTESEFGYNLQLGGANPTFVKLVEKEVGEIRKMLKETDFFQIDIANLFEVDQSLISRINSGEIWVDETIVYPIRKNKENFCIVCEERISRTATYCTKCAGEKRRKDIKKYPITREELKDKIRKETFVSIGEEFSISDNAIRKWCVRFDLPSKKKEIKKYTDEEWSKI